MLSCLCFSFLFWVLGVAEEIAGEGGFTYELREASGDFFTLLLLTTKLPAGLRVDASMSLLNGYFNEMYFLKQKKLKIKYFFIEILNN